MISLYNWKGNEFSLFWNHSSFLQSHVNHLPAPYPQISQIDALNITTLLQTSCWSDLNELCKFTGLATLWHCGTVQGPIAIWWSCFSGGKNRWRKIATEKSWTIESFFHLFYPHPNDPVTFLCKWESHSVTVDSILASHSFLRGSNPGTISWPPSHHVEKIKKTFYASARQIQVTRSYG